MKEYSAHWKGSKQPRKQRKYRARAPLHVRQRMVSSHLDKKLRAQFKKRAAQVRKGDEVLVMRGEHAGKKGVVSEVDLKKLKIFVDSIKVKKVSGQETQAPLDPSNVMITKLVIEDKMRKKSFV